MDRIPNVALKALMDTGLSNLAIVCLVYFLRAAKGAEGLRVEMADMRRALGYSDAHGTYYRQIRAAMAELDGTFLQVQEVEAPVAASAAAKEGRNVVFSVILNPIFFNFSKNEEGQNCNFTSLPKLSDLPVLRAKYRMRAMLLALRWQSGGIVPTMSLTEFKRWFDMPVKWKPSEALDALLCARRALISLGAMLNFTLRGGKKLIEVTAKKTAKIPMTDESATVYRKHYRVERKSDKIRMRVKKLEATDKQLANFARTAAERYHSYIFPVEIRGQMVKVKIERSTGLLLTASGKYLSESNLKRFYKALMAKEA